MKQSKTTLQGLTHNSRSILKKCLILNAVTLGLFMSLSAKADRLDLYGVKTDNSYRWTINKLEATSIGFNGRLTSTESTMNPAYVYAGYSSDSDVTGNILTIDKDLETSTSQEIEIDGGNSNSGNVYNNTVIVKGLSSGRVVAIRGGYSKEGKVSGNTVFIDGIIKSTTPVDPENPNFFYVLAGSSDDGEAYDNRIVLKKDLSISTDLGSFIEGSGQDILEVWNKNTTLTYGLGGFNRYYFVLPNTIQSGDTILSAPIPVAIENTDIGVATQSGVSLNTNDKIILIDKTDGGKYQQVDMSGISLQGGSFTMDYTFGLSLEGAENSLIATVTGKKTNDEIKAPVEGQVSTMALLNAGSDLIATAGLENAIDATKCASQNIASFATISGGYSKYKTGSHINLASASFLTGFAKKFGDNTTSGIFVEAGYGDYKTHNNLTKGKVKGDGDSKYYGLGLMGRYDITNSLYADASIHGGYLNNDWKSNDTKLPVDYDTNSLYYGAHFGLGYEIALNETFDLNVYGKYFYTHQEGDDTTIDGTKFDFKDIDSHITRFGSRFFYTVSDKVKPFVGLAWDHEFDGKAKSYAGDIKVDSPSLKGDTGMLELGLKTNNISNWNIDTSVQGFIGKREGIQGLIKARYNF